MAIFKYPRVDIEEIKNIYRPSSDDNTKTDSIVLFAPFKGNFGPSNEMRIIHSLDEFKSTYGEPSYEMDGQNSLQIRNWLKNGGTVYAMRLEDDDHSVRARYDKYKEHLVLKYSELNNVYFDSDKSGLYLKDTAASLKSYFRQFGVLSVKVDKDTGVEIMPMVEKITVEEDDNSTATYERRYFFPIRKRSLQFIVFNNGDDGKWSSRGFLRVEEGYQVENWTDFGHTMITLTIDKPLYVYNPINEKTLKIWIQKENSIDADNEEYTLLYINYEIYLKNGNLVKKDMLTLDSHNTYARTNVDDGTNIITTNIDFTATSIPISLNPYAWNEQKDEQGLSYFNLSPTLFKVPTKDDNINDIKDICDIHVCENILTKIVTSSGKTINEPAHIVQFKPEFDILHDMYDNFVEDENYELFEKTFLSDERTLDSGMTSFNTENRLTEAYPAFTNFWGVPNFLDDCYHFNFLYGDQYRNPKNDLMYIDSENNDYGYLKADSSQIYASENSDYDKINIMHATYSDSKENVTNFKMKPDNIGIFISNIFCRFEDYYFVGNAISYRQPNKTISEKSKMIMCNVYDPTSSSNDLINKISTLYARYPGSGFNNLRFKVLKRPNDTYRIISYLGTNIIDQVDVPKSEFGNIFNTEYNDQFKYFYLSNEQNIIKDLTPKDYLESLAKISETEYIHLYGGRDSNIPTSKLLFDALSNSKTSDQIKNKLKYPIDVVLDAGYSYETKEALYKYFCTETASRDDVMLFLDCFPLYAEYNQPLAIRTRSLENLVSQFPFSNNSRNMALYIQYCETNWNNENIKVTPIYYISQILPKLNKISTNLQQPLSGFLNAKIQDYDIISINEIPDAIRKERLTKNHINFIDLHGISYYFNLQRTRENPSLKTALREINNNLLTNRLVKEVTNLGRQYLFEYNDAVTLLNFRKSVNSYISEYIANGALSYASVDVSRTDDNEVQLTLNVRYHDIVELIAISLNID